MKVRYKGQNSGVHHEGTSSKFNMHALSEVIVYFTNGECDSMFTKSLEVQLQDGTWKSMDDAFKDRDILCNNHNTSFDYPHSEAEKIQGYNNF